jgi:hypothetical protein
VGGVGGGEVWQASPVVEKAMKLGGSRFGGGSRRRQEGRQHRGGGEALEQAEKTWKGGRKMTVGRKTMTLLGPSCWAVLRAMIFFL